MTRGKTSLGPTFRFLFFSPPLATILTGVSLLPVRAAVVHVPADQPTLQAGIDAAASGDTVLVGPGTYTGPGNCGLDFGGRDLVLLSSGGAASTIVQGPSDPSDPCPRGIVFQSGESASAVVEGFTFREFAVLPDLLGAGGAALLIQEGAAPTIKRCVFESNWCIDCEGGAVLARGGFFQECVFSSNRADGGVASGRGGAIACENTTLEGCVIRGNEAVETGTGPSFGGGVACGPQSLILTTEIVENQATVGGGVSIDPGASTFLDVWIGSSTLASNFAPGGGAALAITSSQSGVQSVYVQQTILWSQGDCGPDDVRLADDGPGSLELNFICSDVDTARIAGNGQVLSFHSISLDPRFCDPQYCGDPPAGGHDYHLLPESPCREEFAPCGALIGATDAACEGPSDAPLAQAIPEAGILTSLGPNPASTSLAFSVETREPVWMRVGVFDVAGALVARLADEEVGPGARSFHWDLRDERGRRVPAGFYAVRVVTAHGTETRPFVVSR